MNLTRLNQMDSAAARETFLQCCASQRWAGLMSKCRPFSDPEDCFQHAERIWKELTEADWMEAFSAHPKIGDLKSLQNKYADTTALASAEQAGTANATQKTLEDLRRLNQEYEEKFGFIFIVCASGRSAPEMLAILRNRLLRSRPEELCQAAGEQTKITRLRLEKI